MYDLHDVARKHRTPARLGPAAVELAVRFLETDPAFEGADPIKQTLAVHLGKARLSDEQRNRLAAVVLRGLRHASDAVFAAYAEFAAAVSSPLFVAAVTCYAASCESRVALRAQGVLQGIRSCGPTGHRSRGADHVSAAISGTSR